MGNIEVFGTCDEKYLAVKERFIQNFKDGKEIGASCAATVNGKLVIDLWAGYMDKEQIKPWEKDTILCVYSTTKIMAALCAHILVDRGQLDLEAPVAKYWPEFAQNGKENLPVKYLLSHSSGLPGFDEKITIEDLYNWDKMTNIMARQKPWWTPGTRIGYNMVSYSFLVGNIIRLVAGKPFGEFFREEVAEPLGLDFHISFGKELDARVADLVGKPAKPWYKNIIKLIAPTSAKVLLRPDPNKIISGPNTREWKAAELASSNGYGNARSMAQVGALLACGGTYGGKQLLSKETIELSIKPQIKGKDKLTFQKIEWGLGWEVNPKVAIGNKSFQWGGYGGSKLIMDLEKKASFAYAMNRLGSLLERDFRADTLTKIFAQCIDNN